MGQFSTYEVFGKMFGFIVKPFEDILHGLEYPIHEVERIFGKLEKFGEELFDSIIAMLKELKNLFNAKKIEDMFIDPFKDAAHIAIADIEHLLEVAGQAGAITADGILEAVETPLKELYNLMKDAIDDLVGKIHEVIEDLKDGEVEVVNAFQREIHSVLSHVEGVADEVLSIKGKIANKFKTEISSVFDEIPEFTGFIRRKVVNATHTVEHTGDKKVTPFSTITDSVKKRLAAEKAAVDGIMMLMVVMIIGSLFGVFYITKSFPLVIILGIILLIAVIIFFLFG